MCAPTLERMGNPLYWILAELQNLQTELIAPCLCASHHLQHSEEKHKPSFVSWSLTSELLKVAVGFMIWTSTVIIISSLIFLKKNLFTMLSKCIKWCCSSQRWKQIPSGYLWNRNGMGYSTTESKRASTSTWERALGKIRTCKKQLQCKWTVK